jgi:methylated-DNA-[protein]-cysteine S-methyltransferase
VVERYIRIVQTAVRFCLGPHFDSFHKLGLAQCKHMKSFRQKVFAIVSRIPKGKVLTYREVARRAGSPKASRAVGNILNKNYDQKIPCHRVIRSDGKAGGYNRGTKKKIEILKREGIYFDRK